jgi:hypothetical protein
MLHGPACCSINTINPAPGFASSAVGAAWVWLQAAIAVSLQILLSWTNIYKGLVLGVLVCSYYHDRAARRRVWSEVFFTLNLQMLVWLGPDFESLAKTWDFEWIFRDRYANGIWFIRSSNNAHTYLRHRDWSNDVLCRFKLKMLARLYGSMSMVAWGLTLGA